MISNTRDPEKSGVVKKELMRDPKGGEMVFYEVDFSSFRNVKNIESCIRENFSSVDILINNAGTWEMKFIDTSDGIETDLQVNHLSPMLLTLELIPLLEKMKSARNVNISWGAHRRDIIDLNDPEWRNKYYYGIATYSQSKLLNLLFSFQLE